MQPKYTQICSLKWWAYKILYSKIGGDYSHHPLYFKIHVVVVNLVEVDFEDFQLEKFSELFLSLRTIGHHTGLIEANNEHKSLAHIPRIGQLLQNELEVTKYLLTEMFHSTSTDLNDTFLKFNHEFGQESTASPISFSMREFLEFLFSEENSVLDPEFINTEPSEEYLSAPLSHYWINSSHNTYLSGNQYNSTSSTECYARAIRQGCRCIGLVKTMSCFLFEW